MALIARDCFHQRRVPGFHLFPKMGDRSGLSRFHLLLQLLQPGTRHSFAPRQFRLFGACSGCEQKNNEGGKQWGFHLSSPFTWRTSWLWSSRLTIWPRKGFFVRANLPTRSSSAGQSLSNTPDQCFPVMDITPSGALA